MAVTHQLPGRTVVIDGQERLYFSGTSYLGIGHNAVFQEALRAGMQRYGTHYGSSRSGNVRLAIYEEAEALLARQTGAEAALTFSSGYLAGQAAVHQFAQKTTAMHYAPDTHPALWLHPADGWHGDRKAWEEGLVAKVQAHAGRSVIVTDSVDALYAQPYSFGWVQQLPADREVTLIIDDSHGLGITGQDGAGILGRVQPLLNDNVELLVTASLGKALGVPGGVVLGKQARIQRLMKNHFFTAGSPIIPAYLYAFVQAQSIYGEARQRLAQNVTMFQALIASTRLFQFFDQYPIFYTPHNALVAAVAPQCVLSSFPYPDPDSTPITRVVVSSLHTEGDLEVLGGLVRTYQNGE